MKASSIIAAMLLPILLLAGDNPGATVSRDDALARLLDGNARCATAAPMAWTASSQKLTPAEGEHPVACVVTCSDSRVVPEMIFDQALGSLFVVRTFGNVPSPDVVASVEYAVSQLHVPVVIVLGHTDCHAAPAMTRNPARPALAPTAFTTGSTVVNASDAPAPTAVPTSEMNAHLTILSLLYDSPVISGAVSSRQTTLIAGMYDLANSKVKFETELAAVALPAAPAVAKAATTVPAVQTASKSKPAKTEVAATKPASAPAGKPAPAAADTSSTIRKQLLNSASFARRSR